MEYWARLGNSVFVVGRGRNIFIATLRPPATAAHLLYALLNGSRAFQPFPLYTTS